MGIRSWKLEFYPPIKNVRGERGAIEHSLTKWEGLRHLNLIAHGLHRGDRLMIDSRTVIFDKREKRVFLVDSSTCSLCKFTAGKNNCKMSCDGCPFVEKFGRTCEPEYSKYLHYGNPVPMIGALSRLANKYATKD